MIDAFMLCMLLVDDRNSQLWSAAFGTFAIFWFCIALVAIIFTIYCWWRVAQKCGYPGVYSLLLLIPLVNIAIQLIWVFSEWPIEAELKRCRESVPRA